MAPARRKRAAVAAAAAAAAAAQWKVGDLVLAKMKGFPAWPAVISEPEQWGYSSVKKKLLVYFYGTKQIAFCNYSDLEAFTEEKKKSLLVKRHGKGADFVRAVKEIVEIYDSLKKEDNNKSGLTERDVRSDAENLANNSSSLDTGGPGEGSDLVNGNKLEDRPASSMDHSMVSTPRSNIAAMVSERCVVNSAPDEPSSSFSKKRQNDARQQDSCTHGNLALPRRLRNSLDAELRRTHDSCGLTNDANLSSVDLIPDDKQKDSSWHKCIGDDQPNSDSLSATKDVVLLCSSRRICSQPGASAISNDDKSSSSTDNVESTRNIEVSQTGVMDKEGKLNGTYDLSMSTTVTFKRKRKPNTNHINNPIISVAPNMDGEFQPKSSGNFADSPNSGNEVNKSDGDEHLPLVKRARVRMGRPLLEDSAVDEPDISANKTELVTHVDRCYRHDLSAISGKDHSADGVPPGIDPSPKVDLSVPSGEVHTACKNKEYQPKVLTLDGEAALPPFKRLHRALEAMSANAAETISNPPEVKKSKELIPQCCIASIASSRSNNSADALVKSPRSAIAKSPKFYLSAHSLDTPTGENHISRPIILDKDSPSTFSLELKNDGSHNPPNYKVCTRIGNDVCEKTPTYSVDSKEPALVPMLDQLPLGKESGNEPMEPIGSSVHDFGKNIDESAEPVSQAKAVASGTNHNCNSVPHDKTVLAKPTDNVGDRTSTSSFVTKASCIQSDAGTQTFEAHGSSGIALKELDHRINPKDKSSSPDLMPMKELITAAHARRSSRPTSFIDSFLDSNIISESLANIPSLKEGSGGRCSPSNHTIRAASDRTHAQQNSGKIPSDNMQQKSLNKLAGHDEASSARRAFEAFLCTLTRTKESIARATRLALECAKHGIAGEVMDIIIERLEKESNLYKRVDVFFLVDSIIQCCRNQKDLVGGVGDVYPSLIQAVLPRILYASAPPGNSAWENRRQCLKVLKLWLERKTLSEYIIRHHIKELETLNEASFGSSRRPSGTERALNDPLRDNEGMLVDEYGSNTGFHLPNLICTKLLDEEGGSSPQRSFEAVTPEHEATGANEQEASQLHVAKHRLVLEEVDGELEMEDVAPSSEAKASSACQPDLTDARCTTTNQNLDSVPPLPEDKPPSPPPLPSSPPPLPRPHSPVFQGSQVQGALHVAADRVEPEPSRATYNVQDQHPHSVANNRGNMDPCVVPSHPPAPYTSGYAGHTNQILPPPPAAPFHPPRTHGNYSGPPVPHHGNNYHQPPSAPIPNNNAYHLQPPPLPPVSNQLPYIPPEPQQRTQPWNCSSSYPERYQYSGHDRGHHAYDRGHRFDDRGHYFEDRGHRFDDGGHRFDDGAYHFDDRGHHFDDRWHHFSDRAVRGQMHHEVADGGRFPSHFPRGCPPFPDHFEASSTPLHCGPPLDPPPAPCPEWSMPPRRSKYPPASGHTMEPPVSHGGGWRRYGRGNYDRYHR